MVDYLVLFLRLLKYSPDRTTNYELVYFVLFLRFFTLSCGLFK